MKRLSENPKAKMSFGLKLRKWSRVIHRDLSFFFAGVIILYSVSGIALNHKRDFNPNYSISRYNLVLEADFPLPSNVDKEVISFLLKQINQQKAYAKHYYYDKQRMKIFLKGGSIVDVDMNTGNAIYEKLQKRPVLSVLNRLHMNPNRWWTWFSDVFSLSLIIITFSGLVILKGTKGLWGRGGVEFILGILIPIIFLLFIL